MSISGFADSASIRVIKIKGNINASGTYEEYLITDINGNKIENFSAKYSVSWTGKLPLNFSGITSTNDGDKFTISVLDSCEAGDIKLSGKLVITNLEDANDSVIAFDATDLVIKNNPLKVTGDISINTNSGSRLYDFSTSPGNINIYFGEDASLAVQGNEKGNKCLAYNINPHKALKAKYSLNNANSAFVNFVGAPVFDNRITLQFAIPVNGSSPMVYQLKEGTTDVLEAIPDAKIRTSGSSEFIYFETDRLAATYVITAEPIKGVTSAPKLETEEKPKTEPPVSDADDPGCPEEEVTEQPKAEEPAVDDTVKSPQTGSDMFANIVTLSILSAMFVICVCAGKKSKK